MFTAVLRKVKYWRFFKRQFKLTQQNDKKGAQPHWIFAWCLQFNICCWTTDHLIIIHIRTLSFCTSNALLEMWQQWSIKHVAHLTYVPIFVVNLKESWVSIQFQWAEWQSGWCSPKSHHSHEPSSCKPWHGTH
jgi:hypothetical protein